MRSHSLIQIFPGAFWITKDATRRHKDNGDSNKTARIRRLIGALLGSHQKVRFLMLRSCVGPNGVTVAKSSS